MNLGFIMSQIFGGTALIGTIIGDNQSNKVKVLIAFIFSNVMYSLQYLCLGDMAGFETSLMGALRVFTYYLFEKHTNKKPLWILLLFFAIIVVIGYRTYQGFYNNYIVAATLLITWALWQNNMRVFRVCAVILPVLYFIYNCYVGAYIGLVTTVIEFIGAWVAIIRLDILKKEKVND